MTTASIDEHLRMNKQFLDSTDEIAHEIGERHDTYLRAVRDAVDAGPVVRVFIELDVAVIDPEWTSQTLLENLPIYVLSALQDADMTETERFDSAYVLDVTDGQVWLPPQHIIDALHEYGHDETPLPSLADLDQKDRP